MGLDMTREQFEPLSQEAFCLKFKNTNITRFFPTYSAALDAVPFVMIASDGYVEIAVKNASAAELLNAAPGDVACLILGEAPCCQAQLSG